MLGAASACDADLLAQRFPCTVDANSRIAARDSGRLGEIVQTALAEIDDGQSFTILRLERGQQLRNALADVVPDFRFSCLVGGKLAPPSFHGAVRCRAVPVVVDDRIAQNAIEPRDNALVVAQFAPALDAPHERRLQNVLRRGAGFHVPFNEGQELPVSLHQTFDGPLVLHENIFSEML